MTSILRQSRERNCWHAITHLQSLQLRKKILKIGKRNNRIEKNQYHIYLCLKCFYISFLQLGTKIFVIWIQAGCICIFVILPEKPVCAQISFLLYCFLTSCFSHNLFYFSDFKPTSYLKFFVLTFTFTFFSVPKKKKKKKSSKMSLTTFSLHMTIWNRNGKMRQRNQ